MRQGEGGQGRTTEFGPSAAGWSKEGNGDRGEREGGRGRTRDGNGAHELIDGA